MNNKLILPILLLLFALNSCGKDDEALIQQVLYSKVQTQENLKIIYDSMKTLKVQVLYEPQAEPFTGSGLKGTPLWDLLEKNLDEVFSLRKQTVQLQIPKTLEEMTKIPYQAKDSYTVDDILYLAKQYGNAVSDTDNGRFVVVFLDGHFNSNNEIKTGVIGINITGTTVIAIFKPVVKSLSPDTDGPVAKFGEQSTLVHEMGHALGLTNNGVPIKTEHHDKDHGAHCTNHQCVMYWQNEGTEDLKDFVTKIIVDGNFILFGQQCLDDIKAYQ